MSNRGQFPTILDQAREPAVADRSGSVADPDGLSPEDAESVLTSLAGFYLRHFAGGDSDDATAQGPILEARYRTLLEQISAIVFMAYLDEGAGEAYVSPQIEATLGFSQQEWLEDPIRWYQQIHPDDKARWSLEAAQVILSGTPLRSVYRVLARDGRTVWFHCDAKIVRHPDGRPWFIQGVAFDITDLKRTEAALHDERNVLSAILDTVGALVVVLRPDGRVARFNRACEQTTGRDLPDVEGGRLTDLFMLPDEVESFQAMLDELVAGRPVGDYETSWRTPAGLRRIAWASTVLTRADGSTEYVIATGIDITERRRLQKTILEISDQEQRRIGQDLHDGLGQHLTGIAFMGQVLEGKLAAAGVPESADAAKIVGLVNEAINKTRELARGMLSIAANQRDLGTALGQIASDVEDLFGISCRLECRGAVSVDDSRTATHLCHITREAVNNAIRHGGARHVVIELSSDGRTGQLVVRDDGAGFPAAPGDLGMGLHIMRYRCSMFGGTLRIDRGGDGPTSIICRFPAGRAGARPGGSQ